ncbi:MAG: RagB/SusD family nutrient uptake outer membrane protein [Saprospiraceae bacterium]|nr:RagB/SusD family nutrient uptake outer membrane protein [Saprospiraceae bacterium]
MRLSICICIGIFCVFSCRKALEIRPQNSLLNEVAITTPADLSNVVEGIYDGLQSGMVLGGNRYIYADLLADDAAVIETQLNAFGTLEIYNRTMTSQINDLRNMWRDGYSVINRANNVIKVIDQEILSNHVDYNPTTFTVFKATALFARAIVHFEMVRFWGNPYDVETPGNNTQLGIPYRKEPTLSGPIGLEIARNSVEEVYNFVTNDLNEANNMLDTLSDGSSLYNEWYRHKVDKWAVKSLLAKVYFFMGKYTEASNLAEEVINSGSFTLETNPRNNFIKSGLENNDEQIFQLISIATDQSGNPAWGYSRYGYPLLTSIESSMSLFHNNDKRLDNINGYFYVSFFGDSTIAKYDLPNATNGINMTVLRLSEMHLIAAESNLSAGGNGNRTRSEELYTELYQTRVGSAPAIPSTNDSLKTSIQLERRLELMYEGDRYHNLKRMKQPLRNGVPYNDPSLLFRIPQEEMSGNSLMVQNP